MRKNEYIPVIKIFLGKGDFVDQLPLAEKRERQGWDMAENLYDPAYQKAKERFVGATVVIEGAGSGACVAFAAEDALKEKAHRVVVDFAYTKTSNEGSDPVQTRARKFFEQLPSRYASDERLLVKPLDVRSRLRRR
jgi:hypothetical protein